MARQDVGPGSTRWNTTNPRDDFGGNAPEPVRMEGTVVAAPAAPAEDPWQKAIREFMEWMNAPLDMNDPYVKQIVNNTQNAAMTDASNRGIEGPMSINNSQAQTAGAMAGVTMQRKGLALQAAQLGANDRLGLEGLKERRRQYDQDRLDASALLKYQNDTQQGTSIGSMVGTGLGYVGGALLAPYTGGTSLAWAPALGGAAGGFIGNGVSGGWSGPPKPTGLGGSNPYRGY